MNKILISVISALLLSSCISLNKFVVTQVGEEQAAYSGRFVYSLPQTVFEVKMEFEKRIELPGPYRQFAQRFLGITQYIKEENTKWAINSVSISEFQEPDPSQFYSVNILKGSFEQNEYFNLSSQGLIIDPMSVISANAELPANEQYALPAVLEFSMKRNHKEKTDTLFKTMITDSSFVKIPILRKQKAAKTIEQKAEEAANLIIKIRKRRLKLVDGEYGVFPEGAALEIAIAELNKTEQEYIALFTGKTYIEKYSRSFFIAPNGNSQEQVFLKFSEKEGVLPAESLEGMPVILESNPVNGYPTGIYGNEQIPENTLIYRMPSTCLVKVKEGNELLFDGRISVYQAGSLLTLPVKMK